jgi:hypothetical protein
MNNVRIARERIMYLDSVGGVGSSEDVGALSSLLTLQHRPPCTL